MTLGTYACPLLDDLWLLAYAPMVGDVEDGSWPALRHVALQLVVAAR